MALQIWTCVAILCLWTTASAAQLDRTLTDNNGIVLPGPGAPHTPVCVIYDDVDKAKASILAIGGRIISVFDLGIVAEIIPDKAAELSTSAGITFVQAAIPNLTTLNANARVTVQVDQAEASPFNLSGTGVSIVEIDISGVCSHDEFQGRVNNHAPAFAGDHSVHVCGTMVAAGTSIAAKGMAVKAKVEAYRWGPTGPQEVELYTDLGNLESIYSDAMGIVDVVLSNMSLGSNIEINGLYPCTLQGNYGLTSSMLDDTVLSRFGRPICLVIAGGNERQGDRCDVETFGCPPATGDFYSMAPPACAKNVISVGAVTDAEAMTDFSSWGPCEDGRIKPDIVAPGCKSVAITGAGLTSTFFTGDCVSYGENCGTSMAAPVVTGCLALIIEDWRIQFSKKTKADPLPATLKAMLIHSAKDLGNAGPDYKFGWGLIQVKAAIDLMRHEAALATIRGKGGDAVIIEDTTSQRLLQVYTYAVGEKGQGRPALKSRREPGGANPDLKVTLVWSDPPYTGDPEARALVNDLDLIVAAPDGTLAYPWQLDKDNPADAAVQTEGRDTVNNVEQVVVTTPATGIWHIRVNATQIREGPTQAYSLIISGG